VKNKLSCEGRTYDLTNRTEGRIPHRTLRPERGRRGSAVRPAMIVGSRLIAHHPAVFRDGGREFVIACLRKSLERITFW
jgi:hypothetical protein